MIPFILFFVTNSASGIISSKLFGSIIVAIFNPKYVCFWSLSFFNVKIASRVFSYEPSRPLDSSCISGLFIAFNDKFNEVTNGYAIGKDGTKTPLAYYKIDGESKLIKLDEAGHVLPQFAMHARTSTNLLTYPLDDVFMEDDTNEDGAVDSPTAQSNCRQ